MKCKILALALGMVLLVTGAAMAQNGPGGGRTPMSPEQRLKRTNDSLFSKLDLKADQLTQMNTIYTDYYSKMDALRSGGERPSREDMQKLGAERDDKVKPVLSADQFKKYQDILEAQRQQMMQRRGNGGGGGGQRPQQ